MQVAYQKQSPMLMFFYEACLQKFHPCNFYNSVHLAMLTGTAFMTGCSEMAPNLPTC